MNTSTTFWAIPAQISPLVQVDSNLKLLYEIQITTGVILVVAAGNFGPMNGSISSFSKLSKVIRIGGASNDGRELCSFSSRGIPGKPFSGPTVVCPSQNIIGETHKGISSLIANEKTKVKYLTRENWEYQKYGPVSDKEWEYVKNNFNVGTGTSQAVEYFSNILISMLKFRIDRGFYSDYYSILSILKTVAQPIKGYEAHEIGFGFVDYRVVDSYLTWVNENLSRCMDTKNYNYPDRLAWSSIYYKPKSQRGIIKKVWWDKEVFVIDITP